MANQYKNKVVYGGTTLIDLTADTVAADKILSGYTAHDATGQPITGSYVPSGGGKTIYSGTFTPDTKTLTQTVTVGTDTIKFVACTAMSSPLTSTGRSFVAGIHAVDEGRVPVVSSNSAGSSAAGNVSNASNFNISQSGTSLTITTRNASGSGYFVAGITYKWWAW